MKAFLRYSERVWAIAFGTVATREPSPVSRSRPYGRVSTIAGALLFVIGFPLVVWLALVVTP